MTKLLRLARVQFLVPSLAIYVFSVLWGIVLEVPTYLPKIIFGYLIILTAQLSISYSNDYFDVEVDKLGTPTFFSGGSGILVENPKLRKPALWIAFILNCCSIGLGILFILIYSYPIWFLGYVVAINILGWLYSAPPSRLVYRGYGELLTAFIVGFFVPVFGYLVVRKHINNIGLLFTIPLVLFGLVFILLVEIPDMEVDRQGNKQTWVAQRGRQFGFIVIGSLLLIATGSLLSVTSLFKIHFPLLFHFMEIFSLLPLGIGIFTILKRPAIRKKAIRLMIAIIGTLGIYFVLTNLIMLKAIIFLG
jgi:1,4-dihydroxy-2-naphthoate octaprenyltransferase